MSVKSAPYYWVECDCCGERMEYGDFSAMSTESDALDLAYGEFAAIDDGHFCEACWTYPEGDSPDDDPVRAHQAHPEREAVEA